jgi:hypothetical protein
MAKIPTAQELGNKLYQPIGMSCNEFAIKLAIEFAKLHVKAALEDAPYGSSTDTVTYEDMKVILDSYPETNIK